MISKIFVDTASFIYFLEKSPVYYEKVRDYLYSAYKANDVFYTSVISKMEFSVLPFRENREFLLDNFEKFTADAGFIVSSIDDSAAVKAARLRSRYSFLRAMDSIQIAVALNNGCNIFYTNDRQLLNVKEIKVVLISDL